MVEFGADSTCPFFSQDGWSTLLITSNLRVGVGAISQVRRKAQNDPRQIPAYQA